MRRSGALAFGEGKGGLQEYFCSGYSAVVASAVVMVPAVPGCAHLEALGRLEMVRPRRSDASEQRDVALTEDKRDASA